jgi:hypothetical protein
MSTKVLPFGAQLPSPAKYTEHCPSRSKPRSIRHRGPAEPSQRNAFATTSSTDNSSNPMVLPRAASAFSQVFRISLRRDQRPQKSMKHSERASYDMDSCARTEPNMSTSHLAVLAGESILPLHATHSRNQICHIRPLRRDCEAMKARTR